MAIRIQHSPSPALMGQVAYAAGAGQEATRRGESNREFNLRNQQARFQNEFALQQAALQEKARREQQQIQIQQQIFNQQRQRAEFNRALQNDAFGRQATQANFYRNLSNDAFGRQRELANDAFDQSYKRAMFGQNQQRYEDLRDQELYSRKEPYLQNTNKVLLQQIEQIREQYDGANWKNNQARNDYLKTMSELPALLAQEVPLETANKSLADFIGNFEQKGFQKKVAPPLSQTELHERDTAPVFDIDPQTGKQIEIGRTWVEDGHRKYTYPPSRGSAGSGSVKRPYPQSAIDKEIEDLKAQDSMAGNDVKTTSAYVRQALTNLDREYGVPASQQPANTLLPAGQGEGEQVGAGTVLLPGARGVQQEQRNAEMQKVQEIQNATTRLIESGLPPEQISRMSKLYSDAPLVLAELPSGIDKKAAANAMNQAVGRGEQPALRGNKYFKRREIFDLIEKSPEDAPLVWNEVESMTTKSIDTLPQGLKAKVMRAKKKASGIQVMDDKYNQEQIPKQLYTETSLRKRGLDMDKKQFNNMVRLVESGELNDEQVIEFLDAAVDQGRITVERSKSMLDQHNLNQPAAQGDDPVFQDKEISRISKEKDMQGYAEMYQRLIAENLNSAGAGTGSQVFNTTTLEGKKRLLAEQANEAFAVLSLQMGKPGFEEKFRKLFRAFQAELANLQQ